jgi:hypothetical protein
MNPFAEMTDKLIEALVHVRVAKGHDPSLRVADAQLDSVSSSERKEFERIHQEHLIEARTAMESAIAVVQRLIQ